MGMRYGGKPMGYRFGPRYGKLTVSDFTAQVRQYFEGCDESEEIPTMSGLAAFTGYDRRQFNRWDDQRGDLEFQPFVEILDQAKAYIEADLVQCMLQGKHAAPGAFALILKNNHGFIEKTEQVIDANVGVRQVVVEGIDPNT